MSDDLNKTPDPELESSRPLTAPRRLAHELVERLAADITSGRLPPGARLPTEQELIISTGVSRTVVREAVAALRAEGLVVTRQGVGAFVAEGSRRPFRIDADEVRSIGEVLQVMELRTGIEVEAAGLAAERATPADHAAINAAYLAIEAALERGEPAVEEDDAFHTAVASAVANPQFVRILEFLGRFMPHQSVRHLEQSLHQHHRYMTKIQREHRDIRDAIVAGAVAPARAAMRRHLLNCHQQYQKVAASLGES